MLVSYKFANFKSFRELTELSLKATRQRTLSEVLIRRENLRLLPSMVIYGANASGKSNLITSLAVMRQMILFGTIKSASGIMPFELLPFAHERTERPMSFEIDFIHGEHRWVYSLAIECVFLQKGKERVVSEELSYVEKQKRIPLFTRQFNQVTLSREKKALMIMGLEEALVEAFEQRINANLDNIELFLSRAFKNTISSEVADVVISFFRERLFVVSDFALKEHSLSLAFEGVKGNITLWNDVLDAFVKGADFGPQSIRYISKEAEDDDSAKGNASLKLFSGYSGPDGRSAFIPAEWMESRGTLKLIDFALPFEALFKEGGIFVLDEFDSSIHPELVKGILLLFNDPEVNRAGAQLIFTTHNPIYLNNNIFRRDQIRFVEKNPGSYDSILYSLADFGSEEVRNDHNYLINYFKGRYGALPFVDFTPFIEEGGVEEEV